MKRSYLPVLTGALLMTLSSAALADFDSDVNKAYAPYRVALFKSNQKDADGTKQAIAKFQSIWTGTVLKDYATPPAKYANEAKWADTLTSIQDIADKAAVATKQGKVIEAHEILEAIRDELDSLRDRNGVRVFSNFVNAYHSEMEHLLVMKVNADNWSDELRGNIRERTGVLRYLSKDLAAHTPDAVQSNPEYQKLLKAMQSSIEGVSKALDSNDPEAVGKAIPALKPAYAKLFLKFG